MKQKLPLRQRLLFLLLPLLLSFGARAQLQRESFEVAPGAAGSQVDVANTTIYTTAQTGSNSQYFVRASNATLSTVAPGFSPTTGVSGGTLDGTFYWAGEGVRGPASINGNDGLIRDPGLVTLIPVNVAGYGNLKVTVGFLDGRNSGANWENDDTLKVQARFGSNPWKTIGQFVGDNPTNGSGGRLRQDTNLDGKSYDAADASSPFITSPMSDFIFSVTGSGSTLQVRIVASENGLSEEFAFDNIRVTGTASSNQAPVLANIEPDNLIYNEGDPAKNITSTLTVSDLDNTTLTSATVKILTNFKSTEDRLVFVNQNGIVGSYNTGTGVLTLTGTASLAAYQAALRSVQYQNTNTTSASGRQRQIEFTVTDAAAVAGTSNPVTRTITVNSNLNAAVTLPFTEDFTTDNGIDKGEGLTYASNSFVGSNNLKFERTNVTPYTGIPNTVTFTNISNGYYFYGVGVSNVVNPDSRKIAELITQKVNTNGFKNINLSVRLGASPNTFDYQDYARISYRIGTGAWVTIGSFRSSNQVADVTTQSSLRQDADPNNLSTAPTGTTLGTALQTFSFSLPAAANNALVDFKIELRGDSQDEEFAFDLIQVTGTAVTAPVVTTTSATNVTSTSATVGGNVTSDGGDAVTGRGVVYSSTVTTPTIGNGTQDTNGTGTGVFSEVISSLTPGTTYYYRAYAINSVGTSYGAVQTFTTSPITPAVTTAAPSSITTNSAVLGGNISADGGAPVTGRGVVYSLTSTNGTPTIGGTGVTAAANGTGTGTFSATISPLTPGTSYSVQAYATNSAGTSYGGVQTFTTASTTPTVTTAAPSSVTTNSAAVGGNVTADGGATVTSRGVVYSVTSTNATPAIGGTGVTTAPNGSGTGTFSATIPGLTPGTNYSVRAYATNAQGTSYGAVQTFTTTALPTVVSVTRLTPSPTATASVLYQVVFSASVTGVNLGNFTLTTNGVQGASVSSVSGSGTTYTVVVNTGTSDGDLRLNVNNTAGNITPAPSNVPYTSGETYTISKTFAAAPTLRIQAAGSAVGNSDVTAFVDVVQVLRGGSVFAGGLQNGSFETNNVPANDFKKNTPTNGVVAAPWIFAGATSGVTRDNANSGFQPPTPPNGDAAALLQSIFGDNSASISQKLAVPTGSYQINFQAAQRYYTSFDQRLNVFVNDVFVGNFQPTGSQTYEPFTSASFNVVAPTLTATITSSAGNNGGSTSTSPIPFTVTFSQNVTGFDATDVTVGNGTLSGFTAVNGSTYTFNVTPAGNGTVTVNVPANGAVDANNTANTAATPFTIQYTQPVTVAPVVTAPANASLTNNAQPTYAGTAPAGSTVTVYVGPASGTATAIGTTTATGGTFSMIQPTNLVDGTYKVYATAQLSGQAVSANSNTNTFTVDATRPSVAITGPTGSTSTSPIPVTVTFSESVSGFVQADVTVGNGTISGFTAVDGRTYTFNVTPAGNGSVTVDVPANVAQDLATNGNTAAAQYAVTYTAVVTATTWTGNISTDWFTAGNWTAGVPTTTLDATIPVVGTRYPLITAGSGSVRNLTLNNGATLTQSAGTLIVTANLTNNGTFNATGGTVVLASTTAANIVGSSATRFWNLTVQPNGLTLATSAGASVQRLLLLNGNFATNGNAFTLESNSAATAMVVNNPGVVNGTVTVQRYIDPSLNAGLGYRHYSSPVQSTTVADLATSGFTPVVNPDYNTLGNTVSTFPTVFGYDESRITAASATTQAFEQGYFSPAALSSPLTVGRGYTVNISASEKVDLNGTLNNGTVAVGALTRGTEANSGWQLLGNPYPSPLDWNAARGSLPTGVQDAIYVYKSSDQYDGTYQTYVNGFGTLPGGLIGSMQGFFLRVSQNVPAFSFQSAWRPTTYQNPTFNRGAADLRPAVQLDLVSAQGTHEPTFIYFEQGATAGFDAHYDAEKLPNTTGLNLSSEAAGQRLAVNGLLPQNAPTTVPLAVGVPTTGTYTLTAASLANLAGTAVYLHDAVTGQQIDLKQQPSYSFSASNAALITGRFTLNFGPMRPTSTKSGFTAASVSLYPNPAHKSFTLLVPAVSGESQAKLTLYNVLGQSVREATLALPAAGAQTSMDVQDLPLGVYMLRIKAGATTVTKQVVVN